MVWAACSPAPVLDLGDGGRVVTDAASAIVDECNPVEQTGCKASARRCVVESAAPSGGTVCIEPAGDEGRGAACAGGECASGLACIGVDPSRPVCERVCNPYDGSGCEPLGADWYCGRRIMGSNWGICIELPAACDADTHAPCGGDEACHPFDVRREIQLRCQPVGVERHGDPCGYDNRHCSRNHVCMRLEGPVALCRALCSSDGDCPPSLYCGGRVRDVNLRFCTSGS